MFSLLYLFILQRSSVVYLWHLRVGSRFGWNRLSLGKSQSFIKLSSHLKCDSN